MAYNFRALTNAIVFYFRQNAYSKLCYCALGRISFKSEADRRSGSSFTAEIASIEKCILMDSMENYRYSVDSIFDLSNKVVYEQAFDEAFSHGFK